MTGLRISPLNRYGLHPPHTNFEIPPEEVFRGFAEPMALLMQLVGETIDPRCILGSGFLNTSLCFTSERPNSLVGPAGWVRPSMSGSRTSLSGIEHVFWRCSSNSSLRTCREPLLQSSNKDLPKPYRFFRKRSLSLFLCHFFLWCSVLLIALFSSCELP